MLILVVASEYFKCCQIKKGKIQHKCLSAVSGHYEPPEAVSVHLGKVSTLLWNCNGVINTILDNIVKEKDPCTDDITPPPPNQQ